jgi:hypothetical protein
MISSKVDYELELTREAGTTMVPLTRSWKQRRLPL